MVDSIRGNLRYDLPSSVVVFLVALPLSIGIAVACGAPVAAGLIAGIVGGIVAGCLGGSVVQVSGPAAGLTVVVAELIEEFGWEKTCFITACAGVVQILFGLSRVARAALAIAPVVVHAMLAGIGITIVLQQIHVLLGGNPASLAWHNITQLPHQLASPHIHAAVIGGVVIAIMMTWRFMPASIRKVPGPLVAVAVGTLLSFALPNVVRITLSGSLFEAVQLPELPSGEWSEVVIGILTVAMIASVESLLSAVAVDKMHSGKRANFDREMIGQGSANLLSGLVGGLPVTGVIVRSSTLGGGGARPPASAVLHGVWILVFAAAFVGLIEQVPKSALAGLLIVVGLQLVKVAHIKLAHHTGDLVIYGATVVAVVFLNLLEGVLLGLVIAFALLLWRIVRVDIHATALGPVRDGETDSDETRAADAVVEWEVAIAGSCTFLALPKLSSTFAKIPEGAPVRLELNVDFIDHAAYEAITDWVHQHEMTGGAVRFHEVGPVRMASALEGPPSKSAPVKSAARASAAEWEDVLIDAIEGRPDRST